MYRALALKSIESGISPDDAPALLALAQRSTIELVPTPAGNRVLLDQRDVSERIRRAGCYRRRLARLHPPRGSRVDG